MKSLRAKKEKSNYNKLEAWGLGEYSAKLMTSEDVAHLEAADKALGKALEKVRGDIKQWDKSARPWSYSSTIKVPPIPKVKKKKKKVKPKAKVISPRSRLDSIE